MYMYMERSMRESESFPHRRRSPSFSTTLLDAIYRSIDESKSNICDALEMGGVSKNSNFFTYNKKSVHEEKVVGGKVRMNLGRAVMMEDWMEKQSSMLFNNSSSSSSSECSSSRCVNAFSFSETEASVRKRNQKHEKPKKVRQNQNQNQKQPTSPGSKIASFLGSIFNSGNVKKAKMCYVGDVEDVGLERKSKSPCLSTSSTASSFSCMRKTQKANKSNNGSVKKRVRFYPVSVILGHNEISQPYQNQNDPNRKLSRNPSMKKSKSCSVMAKEHRVEAKQVCGELNFKGFYGCKSEREVGEEEEYDDALSCSSSDLFELDHVIGIARYRQELPVYETTDLETNKAIANGLRL